MDMQISGRTQALGAALEQQTLNTQLISKTLDKLNMQGGGMTPSVNADYDFQKSVLSAAYAEKGIGARLDVTA